MVKKNNANNIIKGGTASNENEDEYMNVGQTPNSSPSTTPSDSIANEKEETVDILPDGVNNYFSGKNLAIVLLIGLLVLSFLGVNLLYMFGGIIQFFTALIGPFVSKVLNIFGYTTGTIINSTADIVSDTAKTGIDIAEGTAHSVGNLFRNSSNVNGQLPIQQSLDMDLLGANPLSIPSIQPNLDQALNTQPTYTQNNPISDESSSAIQSSMSSNKASWCLVGEYQGKRGCVEVKDQNKCMSGQLYGNQQDCLNLHPSQNNTNNNNNNNISPNQLAPPFTNGTMNWGMPPQQMPPQQMPPQQMPLNMRGMPPPPPPQLQFGQKMTPSPLQFIQQPPPPPPFNQQQPPPPPPFNQQQPPPPPFNQQQPPPPFNQQSQ